MKQLSDILVSELELSVKATNAINRWKPHATLADVDAATDDELLRVPFFGMKALRELRAQCRSIKLRVLTADADIHAWADNHKILIRALMNGEAQIIPIDDPDAARRQIALSDQVRPYAPHILEN